jgi:hypothetical protein
MNRVGYLQAQARLQRARLVIAAGGDPTADLQEILSVRGRPEAGVPDNRPWSALFEEAERALDRVRGAD